MSLSNQPAIRAVLQSASSAYGSSGAQTITKSEILWLNDALSEELLTLNFTARNGDFLAYGLFETLSRYASYANRKDIVEWFQEINVDLMNLCPEFAPPFLDVQTEARRNVQALDLNKLALVLHDLSVADYPDGLWQAFPKDDVNRILSIIGRPCLGVVKPEQFFPHL